METTSNGGLILKLKVGMKRGGVLRAAPTHILFSGRLSIISCSGMHGHSFTNVVINNITGK